MENKKNITIACAGCAGSGKTKTLELLLSYLLSPSAELLISPEEASLVLQWIKESKGKYDRFHPLVDPYAFQGIVTSRQLISESRLAAKAASSDKNVVLTLVDRGISDAFTYLPDSEVAEMLTYGTLEDSLVRYDAVLFFQPYLSSTSTEENNNENRYEDDEGIKALAGKTLEVWKKHSNVYYIPNFETVEEKGKYTALLLNEIVGEEVFLLD